jgi:hypothetical protein
MLRPRRATCVQRRLLPVIRAQVGKHWIARPRLMLCLWKQRLRAAPTLARPRRCSGLAPDDETSARRPFRHSRSRRWSCLLSWRSSSQLPRLRRAACYRIALGTDTRTLVRGDRGVLTCDEARVSSWRQRGSSPPRWPCVCRARHDYPADPQDRPGKGRDAILDSSSALAVLKAKCGRLVRAISSSRLRPRPGESPLRLRRDAGAGAPLTGSRFTRSIVRAWSHHDDFTVGVVE